MASLAVSPPVRQGLLAAKNELTEVYGDRLLQLIVFGSQARGEARPDSDVDVMVVLQGTVDPGVEAERTSRLIIDIAVEYGIALSLVHVSEDHLHENRPLARIADREGVRI